MKTKILRNTLFGLSVIFALAAALPVQLAGKPSRAQHPRYRLIDLGTLGGPNSSQTAPAEKMKDASTAPGQMNLMSSFHGDAW